MKTIRYTPIGVIRSPFESPKDAPLQPIYAAGVRGRIELDSGYEEALADLGRFSHIVLIYHFHLSGGYSPKVEPAHDKNLRGVFATRASTRPNPIGISVVRLEAIDRSTLYISNVDVVDGTPLLDIKPFIPALAKQYGAGIGWLADKYDEE